jgi:hypothetical protein
MLGEQPLREDLVPRLLEFSSTPLTFDEVTARLPHMSWNQLFLALDSLSRRGGVILRGEGMDMRSLPAA